ncbi:MAG: hypothetical protein CSB16_01925 [Clostridiales bacterium]|nr:MAG: hypothetical protein CSB16_01925 [Clostridiales bacterium]
MNDTRIAKGLENIRDEHLIYFCMPGHKSRLQSDLLKYDITEIEGSDNLACSEGIIKNTENKLSDIYKSKKSYISVNGSSLGVLASISSTFETGDEVVIFRNSHISVYNAIYINNLKVHYIYQDEDPEKKLRKILSNNKVKGIVLTTPNYYGEILSKQFIDYLKTTDLIVISDEAHGSHLYLIDDKLSASNYSDVVIHSFHKTLPSMTQTACVHVFTDRIPSDKIKKYINIFQTTSPSYVLMRSIDIMIDICTSDGKKMMDELLANIEFFSEELEKKTDFRVLNNKYSTTDKTRIIVAHNKSIDYSHLERKLRENGIQIEFSSDRGLVLISSIMNTREDFLHLIYVLRKVDLKFKDDQIQHKVFKPEIKYSINKTYLKEKEKLSLENSIGRVVCEYIVEYPPGVPIIVPGEIMSKEIVEYIIRKKMNILLLKDNTINVY